jgi:hypothetical protein
MHDINTSIALFSFGDLILLGILQLLMFTSDGASVDAQPATVSIHRFHILCTHSNRSDYKDDRTGGQVLTV